VALVLLSFKVSSQSPQSLIESTTSEVFSRSIDLNLRNEKYYAESYLVYADSLLSFQLREQKALKRKWWYYLPNIGFSFGMPSISFGSNVIANIDFENEKRKILKEKIIKNWEHETVDVLKKINTTVRIIELELRELEIKKALVSYDKIFIQDFRDSEKAKLITEIELLQKEKAFQELRFTIFQKEKSIFSMIQDLENLSHLHNGMISFISK
jgi:hypothetical protein